MGRIVVWKQRIHRAMGHLLSSNFHCTLAETAASACPLEEARSEFGRRNARVPFRFGDHETHEKRSRHLARRRRTSNIQHRALNVELFRNRFGVEQEETKETEEARNLDRVDLDGVWGLGLGSRVWGSYPCLSVLIRGSIGSIPPCVRMAR
jgi:hypothetical protein